MTNRRQTLAGIAAACAAPALLAQQGSAMRLIVGFAPGGSIDQTARQVAEQFRAALGRAVVVENRAGAAGRLALDAVKAARPDGDTLMLVPHGPMTLFPHIYRNLKYHPVRDFAPVGRVATLDYALATGPQTQAQSWAEFARWAKEPANKPAFGSPGAGTVPHFIGTTVAQRTGLPLAHVPYRGSALSAVDLMGGAIALTSSPLADVVEQHRAGKLRVLATTGSERTAFLTGVPTLRELGIDFTLDGWYGIYAPAATPPERVQALTAALKAGASALREPLAKIGLREAVSDGSALAQVQKAELAFWEPLVKASGFTPED